MTLSKRPKMSRKKQKEMQETMARISKSMGKMGRDGGKEIAGIAAKLHKNALCIVPLYRSCIVVLPPKGPIAKRGAVEIKMYHDPCWMGADERTKKNLPEFCETLIISGQRSGPDLWLDDERVEKMTFYESMFQFFTTDRLIEEATKYRKYDKSGTSYRPMSRKWTERVSPEVRKALYESGYNIYPPVEMVPPSRKQQPKNKPPPKKKRTKSELEAGELSNWQDG